MADRPPAGTRRTSDVTKRPEFFQKYKQVPRAKPLELRFSTKTKMFTPWKFSTTCGSYKTRQAQDGSWPLMALSSFPGSGNTWTRYLIEGATGVFTGSIYNDTKLTSKGFYGEAASESCGCTLLQKTHGYVVENRRKAAPDWSSRRRMVDRHGGRAVLVIRNPYEALLAYRNYAAGHIGYQSDKQFTGESWEKWVTMETNLWREFNTDWLNMTSSVHVVHYENLKQNPILELRYIVRFIGLPEHEGRLACVEQYQDGKFKRNASQKQIFHHRDVFSRSAHALLDSAIAAVQTQLTARHLAPLPLARYKYYATSANQTTLHSQP